MSGFIQLREVSFTYDLPSGRSIAALQSVNLDVRRGEYLVILGHNGSGKSTLARLLNALLLPTSGQVIVDDLDTRDPAHARDIRRHVGLVFQVPDNQLVASTVEEDVAFGPENLGIPHDELKARVQWALTVVGLWEHRQRPPHLLSAGQKQRVAIAGILAMRPSCLVLDEATAMLDPAGQKEVLKIAAEMHRTGTTVIAITHHMAEAIPADRIAILNHGQLAALGSPREVFAHPLALREMGLDVPPVTALAQELHRRQRSFPADLLTLSDVVNAVCAHAPARSI